MFKNPQLVHIAVEITVFLALIFWFTLTNRKTNFFIKNLLQKIDDLENRLLKLESLFISTTKQIAPVKPSSPIINTPVAPPPSVDNSPMREPITVPIIQVEVCTPAVQTQPTCEISEDIMSTSTHDDEEEQFESDLREELAKLEIVDAS